MRITHLYRNKSDTNKYQLGSEQESERSITMEYRRVVRGESSKIHCRDSIENSPYIYEVCNADSLYATHIYV